jgi:hypothetical protein
MRLTIAAKFCVVAVATASLCASAQEAPLDPVERLFQDQPTATRASDGLPSIGGNEPVSAILSEESLGASSHSAARGDASPNTPEPTLWDAAGADEGVGVHVSDIATVERSTSEPAATVNAVPEPSAILLALAALVYFLLFGRRRRMV